MSQREMSDLVWESLPGASQLKEIYGYWPTLHDAIVRDWDVRFQESSLALTIIYSDGVGDDDSSNSATTQFTLAWRGVQEAKFRYYAHDLYGLLFARMDDWIETRFDDYVWGMDGYIRSSIVEVLDIQDAPDFFSEPEDSVKLHQMNFSFKP
jgi:hypothetical protein